MTKPDIKKSPHKLIVIEGFWKIGKSALIKKLLERRKKAIWIPEPNHLDSKNIKNYHYWYCQQHLKRHRQVKKLVGGESLIIMERSILSNIAFYYAKHGKIPVEYFNILKQLPELHQSLIVFLYAGKKFCQNAVDTLRDKSVKKLMQNRNTFYQRYLDFYKNRIKIITGNRVLCVNVASKKIFLPMDKIVNLIDDNIENLGRKKVIKEICASIILFHKQKILLLYDKNWHHYVLPQGHKEQGEKLTETAVRETIEETGFNNLKMIKKLGQYNYFYSVKGRVVNKHITVYLLKAINLTKIKKTFKSGENYINKFFNFRQSFKYAKWPQDKLFIKKAFKFIKESPHIHNRK